MNNKKVLIKFLQGEKAQTQKRQIPNGDCYYEGRTLSTDGKFLTNYSTIIAYKQDDKLYLNKGKYSITTSKIQGQLNYLSKDYYNANDIIYYEDNDR